MFGAIQKSTRAIAETITKLNKLFDNNRKQLEQLEMVLNKLGNPGSDYIDDLHFHFTEVIDLASEKKQISKEHRLCFIRGEINIQESSSDYRGPTISFKKLPTMSLFMTDGMLMRLPIFLEGYQEFLETKEALNSITLNQITKMVLAIAEIINSK